MVESFRKGPCIWNDDEDMVMRRWRSSHQIIVKQPDHFSRVSGTTMKTWSPADEGGVAIRLWLSNPTTFPVQLNKAFGWNWVSYLAAILCIGMSTD
jgi:hypothetical protein